MKICCHTKLYNGLITENIEHVIHLIHNNQSILNIYFICIDKKTHNLIEIYHSIEMGKPCYEHKNLLVIGVAEGKTKAFALTSEILFEYYTRKKSFKNFKNHYFVKSGA